LVDFDARWSRHDRRRPEEYLRAFSAVAEDTEAAVDVIYAEYLAREQSGERPPLAEYQERFPAFADILAQQIRLHEALDSLSESGTIQSSGDPSTAEASYEVLEQIGSGGMGVVYRARQVDLNRDVALKMVRAIDAGNPELLARFRSEAHIVAGLHHPHIVQVFDFGEHEGLPYIAMELVAGGSLADRLVGVPWDPKAAAALLCQLAEAVQYAHERHVVHRDLKPANVLVVADAPKLDVKITDFGLAKLLADDLTQHTRSFSFIGTPSYMAPEQAGGRAREIGPASDIYSLGAIFFELLTGQPPFRGESPLETLRLVLRGEPVSLRRANPRISRDLATICDKCLQADVKQRYASAADLRADLERYLEGRPIQARPVGSAERAWRWAHRNPYLAGALGSVVLLLLGIAAVSVWYSDRLSRELTRAHHLEQAERRASEASEQRLWNVYLNEAAARNSSRQVGQRFAALESLDKALALPAAGGRSSDRQRQVRGAVLSSVALPDLRKVRSIENLPAKADKVEMSVAADCYIVAAKDGSLTGFRLSDSQKLWTIELSGPQRQIALSRDGRLVATVDAEIAKVWHVDGSQPRLAWEKDHTQFVTIAPDGEHVLCSDRDAGMELVRLSDGAVVQAVGKGAARSPFAYSARGDRIAVCGADSVQVIDVDTGAIKREFPLGLALEPVIAWHPSGEFLAVWASDDRIVLWNVETGDKTLTFPHSGKSAALCFSDDGSVLITQSLWDRRLCAWNVGTGQRMLEVPEILSLACAAGPERSIVFLAVRGAGTELTELTAGARRTLAQSLDAPLGFWHKVSVGPDGRIATFSGPQGLELWDLATTRRLLARKIGNSWAEFDRAGRLIVGCRAGVYRFPRRLDSIIDPEGDSGAGATSHKSLVRFGPAEPLAGPMVPPSLAINAVGDLLLFQDVFGWVVRHEGQGDQLRLETMSDPRKGAVSEDRRFIALANWDGGGATVWDASSGNHVTDLAVGRYGVPHFSPDGRFLALTPDGVTLWSTSDWRCVHRLGARGTTPTGLGIAFSPDSRALAVSQLNGVLSLVDPLTGNEWASWFRGDSGIASIMAFSPDQRWLITSSIDEGAAAQVWDLAAMRRALFDRGLDLPADVLRAGASEHGLEDRLEVLLHDAGLLDSLPPAGSQVSPVAPSTTR
jgi:serine/threonine-protein kinase